MQFENLNKYEFVLASKSPRRQYLLKALGLTFSVHTKEVDESFSDSLKAQDIPLYLCKKKADAFQEELKDNTVVITSDTIVWVEGEALNKPENFDDAVCMLKLLSGRMHEVYTGVCLKSKNKTKTFYSVTKVFFKKLSQEEIEYYIKNYNPYDKAGSYGAQECSPANINPCSEDEIEFLKQLNKLDIIESSKTEVGVGFVEKMEGSYFNVMGLPIQKLYEELLKY